MTDLTALSPAEVDALWNEATEAVRLSFRYTAQFVADRNEVRYPRRGGTVYSIGLDETLERFEALYAGAVEHQRLIEAWRDAGRVSEDYPARPAASRESGWDTSQILDARRHADALVEARANVAACNDEWERRGGWSRAYLVVSSAKGHIHRNWCGSWRWTTQVAIVVDLSGKDEADIVDYAGEKACSRCFKSAPVAVPQEAF